MVPSEAMRETVFQVTPLVAADLLTIVGIPWVIGTSPGPLPFLSYGLLSIHICVHISLFIQTPVLLD